MTTSASCWSACQVHAANLIEGGLNNRYNATIAKMLLSRAGYAEKTEQGIDPMSNGETVGAVSPNDEVAKFNEYLEQQTRVTTRGGQPRSA